ncbi:MAG: hypothetical protein SGI96_21315 [Bacteroidota bacterium]|nr:hypothetical protein [Bacteroidota bacterium]
MNQETIQKLSEYNIPELEHLKTEFALTMEEHNDLKQLHPAVSGLVKTYMNKFVDEQNKIFTAYTLQIATTLNGVMGREFSSLTQKVNDLFAIRNAIKYLLSGVNSRLENMECLLRSHMEEMCREFGVGKTDEESLEFFKKMDERISVRTQEIKADLIRIAKEELLTAKQEGPGVQEKENTEDSNG